MATAQPTDNDSDYGWDLSLDEEELLVSLNFPTVSHPTSSLAATGRDPPAQRTELIPSFAAAAAIEFAADPVTASLYDQKSHRDISEPDPLLTGRYEAVAHSIDASERVAGSAGETRPQTALGLSNKEVKISYPDLSNDLSVVEPAPEETAEPSTPSISSQLPPLVRFRTYPKKPLSVSDLTAGAWCELQYAYTLTLLPGGKRTRTAAMKGGSKVHKELEDEVHVTVQIEVTKREDAFGLKLWNIIQGLRTLRQTGLTRELEVWGVIDGNVVNGIIDGLSYDNPDPQFEDEGGDSGKAAPEVAPDQQTITEFFPSSQPPEDKVRPAPKIYLTDVKTRASNTLPKGAAVRPTKVQLFLYHRFLGEMACGQLDFLRVIRRYGLDPDEQFSDSFLAQVGELHDEIFYDAPPPHTSGVDLVDDLSAGALRYQSLRALIALVADELRLTFPQGAESLGKLVAVEYRARARKPLEDGGEDAGETGGRLIGTNVMQVDNAVLDEYLASYMQWWRGEREPRGVDIEEFYKCGFCEFAEQCDWRRGLHQEATRLARERSAPRRRRSGTTPNLERMGSVSADG